MSTPATRPAEAAQGRRLPLSLPRRWTGDIVHFARRIPLIPFERSMDLHEVVQARRDCVSPPGWCAIFVKAYALVAARRPALRQSYMPFPLPYLYEHPCSIASVVIEKRFQDEDAIFPTPVKQPESLSLMEIDAAVRRHKTEPAEIFPAYRRLLQVTRLPRPLRRLVWRAALDFSGELRANYFGTFCVSTTAGLGASALSLLAPVTSTLWYGPLDDSGRLDVRLTFDHRVLDGAPVSRAMIDLEQVLHEAIVPELRGFNSLITRRSLSSGAQRVGGATSG